MKEQISIESDLWKNFESAAKANRRNPLSLLASYMRETLEIWEHENLDREIQKEARKSKYSEADAVAIVKKYRRENKRAAS